MLRPTIVCLCGSTRFSDAFREAQLRETLDGRIVLTIGCNMKSDIKIFGKLTLEAQEAIKQRLDKLHLRKIDLADEILVLNVGGYIGDSTRAEILYAKSQGKKIRYLEGLDCQSYLGAGRCDISGELCIEEARGEDCSLKEIEND